MDLCSREHKNPLCKFSWSYDDRYYIDFMVCTDSRITEGQTHTHTHPHSTALGSVETYSPRVETSGTKIIEQHLYEYKKAPLERFTFLQISSELIFVYRWMVELGSVIKVKPGVTRGPLWSCFSKNILSKSRKISSNHWWADVWPYIACIFQMRKGFAFIFSEIVYDLL